MQRYEQQALHPNIAQNYSRIFCLFTTKVGPRPLELLFLSSISIEWELDRIDNHDLNLLFYFYKMGVLLRHIYNALS